MNRINQKFQQLRQQKQKAFLAFLTAGVPSLRITEELVLAFEKAGVDIIELGVPFSDPMADGPVIQASSQKALQQGVSLRKILKSVKTIRGHSQIPIALMTYYNPVFRFGEKEFVRQARRAGVDGLIIPDLPPEEAGELLREARRHDLAVIFFLSPTTTQTRLKDIVRVSRGFIYYVSLTGVTGIRRVLPQDFVRNIRLAKRFTQKPICVGFGISTPEQARRLAQVADGVIVGSAIVREINRNWREKELVKNAVRFVRRLERAVKLA